MHFTPVAERAQHLAGAVFRVVPKRVRGIGPHTPSEREGRSKPMLVLGPKNQVETDLRDTEARAEGRGRPTGTTRREDPRETDSTDSAKQQIVDDEYGLSPEQVVNTN